MFLAIFLNDCNECFFPSIVSDFSSTLYLHELLTGSEVYVHPLRLPEKVKMKTIKILLNISQCYN